MGTHRTVSDPEHIKLIELLSAERQANARQVQYVVDANDERNQERSRAEIAEAALAAEEEAHLIRTDELETSQTELLEARAALAAIGVWQRALREAAQRVLTARRAHYGSFVVNKRLDALQALLASEAAARDS